MSKWVHVWVYVMFLLLAILLKLTSWQIDFLKERADKLEARIEKLETKDSEVL